MIAYAIALSFPLGMSDASTSLETPACEPTPAVELFEPASRDPLLVEDDARGGGTYMRVSAGLLTMEDSDGPSQDIEFNEGILLGVAFGQRMNSGEGKLNFDLELEAIWTDQDADDSGAIQSVDNVSVGALFLNGTADFPLGERLSIYLGAGIGAAWMDVDTQSSTANDFDSDEGPYLAWQGRTGFQWAFANGMALNLGYRIINVDDAEIDDDLGGASFELETVQHVAEIGLRFGL